MAAESWEGFKGGQGVPFADVSRELLPSMGGRLGEIPRSSFERYLAWAAPLLRAWRHRPVPVSETFYVDVPSKFPQPVVPWGCTRASKPCHKEASRQRVKGREWELREGKGRREALGAEGEKEGVRNDCRVGERGR